MGEQQRAELAPTIVGAHHWYATALLTMGQPIEAKDEVEKARKLDPTFHSVLADRAFIELKTQGREKACLNYGLVKGPSRSLSVFIAFSLSNISEEAMTSTPYSSGTHRKIVRRAGGEKFAVAARNGWRHSGRTGMLEDMLFVYKAYFKQDKDSGYNVAIIDALLGNKVEPVSYLETSCRTHDFVVMNIANGNLSKILGDYPSYRSLQTEIA